MKKGKVFVVALALLALVAGTAQAEMYVEGYLGANFAANSSGNLATAFPALPISFSSGNLEGNIDPALTGGIKLGAWFEQSGVLSGINFPTWMKYMGFFLDFQYHRVDFAQRGGSRTASFLGVPFLTSTFKAKSEGAAATMAFMFAFRYGFLKDKEVPFGRLQPYIAIGPAIMFTWQQPTFTVENFYGPGADLAFNPDSTHSNNVALQLEGGLRWMCLRNVSVDLSFKWRKVHGVYDYTSSIPFIFGGIPVKAQQSRDFNFFSVNLGAAYHF